MRGRWEWVVPEPAPVDLSQIGDPIAAVAERRWVTDDAVTLAMTRELIEWEERVRYRLECIACEMRAERFAAFESVDRRDIERGMDLDCLRRDGHIDLLVALAGGIFEAAERIAEAKRRRREVNDLESRISQDLMIDLAKSCPHVFPSAAVDARPAL